MEEKKVQSISDWPPASCKRDVQLFMGMVNFYRRFIKGCSALAQPLTFLTGKSPFRWTNREQNAFDRLRIAVSSAPVLRCFDPDLPTFITSDASEYVLCAFLEQEE
jgi:RNase H-like domain found in reverse transcriptase